MRKYGRWSERIKKGGEEGKEGIKLRKVGIEIEE
jgi:hypothetical protein